MTVDLRPREKIRALTSLRFFAALWVMLFHTAPRTDALSPAAGRIIDLGYSAVTLFFVLSGFILAKVYQGLSGRGDIARFLVARFARVYPMYLLSLLIDVPRLLLFRIAKFGLGGAILATGATFGFQAGLLQSWITRLGALNFPSWSISTEAFFYLMFPMLLPLTERIVRARDRILLMAALLAISAALTIMLGHHAAGWRGDEDFWRNPILRLPEFVFGLMLAPFASSGDGTRPSMARRMGNAMLTASALSGLVLVLVMAPVIGQARLIEVLLTPTFAAIIILMASNENSLLNLVSGRALVLLGEASYALYLLHAPVAAIFAMAGLGFDHWFSPVYGGYLAVTIAASIAAHLLFEHPMRRWIMRLWDTARPPRRNQTTSTVA